MTENEAIKILKEEKSWESDNRKIDAFIMGIEAFEEIQQYRSIGTVEELKALKLKEHNYENCHNFTCKHKSREVGFNIGYNKAIDEFAKEIRDWQIDIQDNEYDADKFDFVFERINQIAEQMKEGAE